MNATPYQVLFNLILYVILLFFSWKSLRLDFTLKSFNRKFLIIGIFIFFLFPFFGGDYFHYMEIFDKLKDGYTGHMETIYLYIAQFTGYYTVWRIIVWGSCLFLILNTFQRLDVKYDYCLFFCITLYMLWLSYARVSLAMALVFWGLSYLVKPIHHHRLFSFFLGIVAIGCSYFFHKSALFGIGMASCSLLTIKMNKSQMIILILLIPLFLGIAENFLNAFMDLKTDAESLQSISSGQSYMSGEYRGQGIGKLISITLIRAPFYFVLCIYGMTIFQNKYQNFPINIKIFSSISAIIITGASIFAFNFANVNTSVLYYRFLFFSMIPCTIFLAYCFEHHLYGKLIKTILYIGISGNIYTLLYSTYLAYVK